ncbi:zinc finger MYM-type 1-like [Paramuricea clavata]|uniref:Zinc finger MYM-type 1-like n=1 Tax=Paramuricea clavata TaxID=317549 RepID=A0A6S7I201_PARCT|nr:zinc finger MYM-type 1-like [Paramuricea clavata]
MEVNEKITNDIKDAGVFSIMADTTPDVSHKDQMSVICRYVDHDGAVHERLLDLKEVREKTGEGQATAIIQSVDQNGLDNKSIAFQSYDFTNTRAESLRAMWISYEAVIEVLRKISNDGSVDAKGKAAATGLLAKVLRVDVVVSLMFMRIILWKTKVLTESLQKEDLNIVDALEALDGTVKSLQDIRKDDEGIANQIQASTEVLSGKDVDAAGEFAKLQYKGNINASLEKVKALSIVLQPPLSSHHVEKDVKDLLNLFPLQAPDQAAFTAEFEVFVNVAMNEGNTNPIQSLADAAKEAEKRKHIFPLTSQVYRLALTSPVTVAGNERTFSKLKTENRFA